MEILQPDFDYNLVACKGEDTKIFSGKSCLTDFKKDGLEGLTELGWKNEQHEVSVNLKDGSFKIDGQEIKTDLGLTGRDFDGNVKAIRNTDLELEPIWFRKVSQVFHPDERGIEIGVRYCIGWKARYEGRVYQKIGIVDNKTGEFTLSDRK